MAKSNQQKFIFPAGDAPKRAYLISRENEYRAGMLLANPNSASNAQIRFCLNADLDWDSGVPLVPNEKYYADYVTPEDAVYAMTDTPGAILVFIEGSNK